MDSVTGTITLCLFKHNKRNNEIIIINQTYSGREHEREREKGGGRTSKVASVHHLTMMHFNSIIYFKIIHGNDEMILCTVNMYLHLYEYCNML